MRVLFRDTARARCRAQTARPGRGAPACAHRWRPASAPDRPPPRDRRSPADCGTLILGPADPYLPQILFRSDQGRNIPAGGPTITYKYSLAGQIGSATCGERGGTYVVVLVGGVLL